MQAPLFNVVSSIIVVANKYMNAVLAFAAKIVIAFFFLSYMQSLKTCMLCRCNIITKMFYSFVCQFASYLSLKISFIMSPASPII